MKMYVFEGSPDEISKFYQTLESAAPNNELVVDQPKVGQAGSARSEGGLDKFVTPEFALDVLTRLKLSKPMKSVISALYNAEPEWVPTKDLLEASGYTSAQFSGLMGAFGRRIAHTKNFDDEAHFFDYRSNDESGSWEYRLPETVKIAIRENALV